MNRMKDMSNKILAKLFLIMALCWATQHGFAAQSARAVTLPPQPPHILYGTVTIDGNPATDGTTLSIVITHSPTETVTASTTTFSSNGQSGYYTITLLADDSNTPAYDGGLAGDLIIFSVADKTAGQSAVFSHGSTQALNLTLTSPTVTPTETTTNTPTATVTNTPIPPTATATPAPPTATSTASCPIVVTSSADSGAGSLRQAIANASANCSQISFDAGLLGQTIRLASQLVIVKNLTIDGSGRKITISGDTNNDGNGDVPVFTVNGGVVTLRSLTIADGFGADGLGGGVSISPGAHVSISHSTIRNNISDNGSAFSIGGGIFNVGVLTLTNSTVSGNQAANLAGLGGGLHSGFGSSTTIRFSTIVNNSAPSSGLGGGINVEGGTVSLVGSIVSGNSADTGAEISVNNGGTLTIDAHNVFGVNGSAGLDGASASSNDHIPSGALSSVISPTLADNGGDSPTHLLLESGVAYNAIPANTLGCGSTTTVDQRGLPRPVGNGCDAGAVESQSVIVPTATATNTPLPPSVTPSSTPVPPTFTATSTATATPTNTPISPTATPTSTAVPPTATPTQITQHDCTQAALLAAISAAGSGTVNLDGTCRYLLTSANYNSAYSGASGVLINSATTLQGNGATIERATTAPQFRLLILSKPGIVVRNLTLRSGDTPLNGGALLTNQDAALENVRIENNVAMGNGGGLYAVGNLTLNDVTFTNNQAAGDGGGAYVTHYAGITTTVLLDRNLFFGNRAGGNGGGLYHFGQSLQLSNSIFARNKSTQLNGGAQLHKSEQGSALTILHSSFTDDLQNSNPAIFVWSSLNLQNSIVANHRIGVGTAGGSLYPVSEDYNLYSGNGNDVTVIYNGSNITRGTHSIVAINPRFVDTGNDNYRLAANSPAIDSGTIGGSATDADGKPRPAHGVADIGAYEFQGEAVAALQISKESPPWIVANHASRYALTVFNAGKVSASNLQIIEQLPAGATYVANSASDSGVFASGKLTWSIGDLAPGTSKRVEYRASANQALVSDNYRVISNGNGGLQEVGKTITTPLNQKIVAAIDFQPNPDGFAFPNYTDSPQSDLTADDVAFIFGANNVCKSQNPCVLSAAAEAWRQAWLLNVEGGHCAGFAMGSLDIFANGSVAPNNFQSGANVTFDLTKANARRYIALYATTQTKYPTTWATLQSQGLQWVPAGTPATVLDTLLTNLSNPNAPDRYRLSISLSPAVGGGGGHTIVPYAIEQVNNDEYLVYVYENNAPNDYTRVVRINRSTNSWSYEGTTAPGQSLYNYYGTVADNNIQLVSWRWASTFPKACDNSACSTTASQQIQAAEANFISGQLIEFQLDGEGYLLVTRNDGKRVGFDPSTGDWINEIDGAERIEINSGLGLNLPPILQIPHGAGATYRIQVSNRETAFGNLNATANVNIFAANLAVRLTGLQINSPELTPVDIEGGVSAAATEEGIFDEVNIGIDPTINRVTYQASSSDGDTPALSMAVSNPDGADYSFTVDKMELGNNQSVALAFDKDSGALSVENNDSSNSSYSVAVARINSNGTTDTYQNDNVIDGDGVGVILQLGDQWNGTTPPTIQENDTPTLPGLEQLYLPLVSR